VFVDSVNGDHVRVPYAGEQTTLLDDGVGAAGRLQHLQRDLAFESRIPRQVDGAKTTAADLPAELERSPSTHRRRQLRSRLLLARDTGRRFHQRAVYGTLSSGRRRQ
jgi:hypothetical protein